MFHDPSPVGTPLIPGHARRFALLIDAENVPRERVAAIIDMAMGHGVTDIRRAYGDWAGGGLKSWRDTLLDHAIRPVQQFSYTAGKNASDIALVIDAMELLHTVRPDGFCLVSSDADFTPLAMHLRANGLEVHGFGEAKTPRPFVTACTSFVDIGALSLPHPESSAPKPSTPKASAVTIEPISAKVPAANVKQLLAIDASLASLLRTAVRDASRPDGWAPLSTVGSLARRAGVDPATHGCKTFSALLVEMKLFEVRNSAGGHVTVRERHRAAKMPSAD